MPKILIVDDQAYVSTQLEERLTSMGYDVVGMASSGEASIEMAKSLHPDLVLMDIVLPGKFDGIAAAEIIREEQDIPVIFLTAYAEDQFIERAKHVEPFGYIVKPFQEGEIKASIEVALHKMEIERWLCESERKYRLLVGNIPGIVFTGYKDWSVDFIDNKIETLTGYAMEDFNSRKLKWIDIVAKDDIDQIKRIFTEALKSNKIYIQEHRIKSRKEEIIWIQQRGQIVCDNQGEVSYVSGVFFDISDRKRAEEEKKKLEARLQQVQKMEAIGALASNFANDFNNLLMSIHGNASLMLFDTDTIHPHHERLRNIELSVKRGADLTRQLLGLSVGGKYEIKITDLNEIMDKTSSMFGRTKREIKIHREYQKDIWTVEIDQGQIEQVLLNLYVNAAQAMPGSGDLYLQSENVILDEAYVEPFNTEPGRYVKISVTDTGVGMDEATQKRIFEPFFTTKEMGRRPGLALASVYGIIKNHNGIINVYSEKGKGTTFNIYLPASDKEVIKEKELSGEVLRGKETVLLIDDEDTIIDVGQEILKALGYTVLVARSGKEAIEIVSKAHRAKRIGQKGKERYALGAVPPAPDLVILDMIMPEIGGGEAYERMKEINPDIKVLLSSGFSINGEVTEILERGCNGFIQKPFNIRQLSQRIREILDKKQS